MTAANAFDVVPLTSFRAGEASAERHPRRPAPTCYRGASGPWSGPCPDSRRAAARVRPVRSERPGRLAGALSSLPGHHRRCPW